MSEVHRIAAGTSVRALRPAARRVAFAQPSGHAVEAPWLHLEDVRNDIWLTSVANRSIPIVVASVRETEPGGGKDRRKRKGNRRQEDATG
jgi:hypothetical protein